MTTETFINIKEVSTRTGLSRRHLYSLVESGKIPSYKPFGKKLFFLWDEVYLTMKGENSCKPTTQNTLPQ